MSYRLIGVLRAETSGSEPSPALSLILALLGEGYTLPEITVITGFSVSVISTWVHSDPQQRARPGTRSADYAAFLLGRLNEHFAARSDTFPLPPNELKTLLLL